LTEGGFPKRRQREREGGDRKGEVQYGGPRDGIKGETGVDPRSIEEVVRGIKGRVEVGG